MKNNLSYKEIEKAVKILKICGKTDLQTIKNQYKKLSKLYHPDVQDGNTQEFQKINDAYQLLLAYITNYKFEFSKEEFENQYPFSKFSQKDWLYGI